MTQDYGSTRQGSITWNVTKYQTRTKNLKQTWH